MENIEHLLIGQSNGYSVFQPHQRPIDFIKSAIDLVKRSNHIGFNFFQRISLMDLMLFKGLL